jgi:putative ABC transport system permease protein
VLKRIPGRVVRCNLSHFLGIIFLTFLTTFTYFTFSCLAKSIKANYAEFINGGNQERFHFYTLKPIDVKEFEKKYGLVIQEHHTFDHTIGQKVIRFFDVAQDVNRPYIDPKKKIKRGEVALNYSFCKANGIELGDYIKIEGRRFKVGGYAYLPNYVYVIQSDQDLLPNPKAFGVGLMNYDDMKELGVKFKSYYYAARGGPDDLSEIQKELNQKYILLNFVEKDEDLRIITTELKMQTAEPMTYAFTAILVLVSSFLLFLVIRRTIGSMHYEIGTLYALGFTGKELLVVLMRFPLIIWLSGSLPGFFIGLFVSKNLVEFYLSYFEIPLIKDFSPVQEAIVGFFIPGVFMFVATYAAVISFLKLSPVEIVRGKSSKASGKALRLRFVERLSFKRRLMLKHALMNISRELLLVFGVAFATFLLLYVVVARAAFTRLIDKTYGEDFKYNYVYFFNGVQLENPYPEAERFNFLPFEAENADAKVYIYGIERNTEFINLRDEKGQKLQPDGLIITRPVADKLNLKVGDTLKLKSKVLGREFAFEVKSIASIYAGNHGYLSLESFNRTFGFPKGAFVGLYSRKKLNIPEDKLSSVLNNEHLIKAFNASMDTLKSSIQIMGAVAFFFALSIVYVLSSLTISENHKPIALFKILGYKEQELSTIFLGFNKYSFLAGFVLGLPAYSSFINYIYRELLKSVDFAIDMKAGMVEVLASFLILAFVFVISTWLSLRKILKIQAAEILKEQMD